MHDTTYDGREIRLRLNKRKRRLKVKECKRNVSVSSSLTTIKRVVNIQARRKLFRIAWFANSIRLSVVLFKRRFIKEW